MRRPVLTRERNIWVNAFVTILLGLQSISNNILLHQHVCLNLRSLPDIYIFGIGAEIYESDLKPLTAGTGGNHFFKMKDINNLQETFDEIIGTLSPTPTLPLLEQLFFFFRNRHFTDVYLFYTDEEEVVGLCGLHKGYETSTADSTRKMYPWMAAITVQVNVSAVLLELQHLCDVMGLMEDLL